MIRASPSARRPAPRVSSISCFSSPSHARHVPAAPRVSSISCFSSSSPSSAPRPAYTAPRVSHPSHVSHCKYSHMHRHGKACEASFGTRPFSVDEAIVEARRVSDARAARRRPFVALAPRRYGRWFVRMLCTSTRQAAEVNRPEQGGSAGQELWELALCRAHCASQTQPARAQRHIITAATFRNVSASRGPLPSLCQLTLRPKALAIPNT